MRPPTMKPAALGSLLTITRPARHRGARCPGSYIRLHAPARTSQGTASSTESRVWSAYRKCILDVALAKAAPRTPARVHATNFTWADYLGCLLRLNRHGSGSGLTSQQQSKAAAH